MKNIFIVIMTCFLSSVPSEYSGVCLLIPHNEQVPIYSDYNKQEIKGYAINDDKIEDYPLIGIYAICGDMAFVDIEYLARSRDYIKGWIGIKHLGVFLNVHSEPLRVYTEPDYNSDVSFLIKDGRWGIYYQVIDAHDQWLKIIVPQNPDNIGWLSPEDQSVNPYTVSC